MIINLWEINRRKQRSPSAIFDILILTEKIVKRGKIVSDFAVLCRSFAAANGSKLA